jgi:hypothetical protein
MLSYSQSLLNQYGVITYAMKHYNETYEELKQYCDNTGLSKEFKECERINHAWFERVKRLKDRINNIIQLEGACFITLTFSDKVLNETNEKTRRTYVARWCKSLGAPYVANIDFGSKTHREHYHCIIGCKVSKKSWLYGFMDIEPIRLNANSGERLSKYVAKLTNHCIKETTKRQVIIYSRNA